MLSSAMSGRASSPVLVGRAEQMAALEGAFRSVRQGGSAAVLLGGEAGVGKSRLVSEFSAIAKMSGARVLAGGCMQLGADGLPFAPFTAVLRDLVHEMGAGAFTAMLPGRAVRELARLLPELGAPAADGDSGTTRARLFEEVLSAFEQLCSRSPVVLVIEDAHWADRSSRDLLTFLIGNQRTLGGLLLLVTFRSDELHRTHPLRPLLATLDRIAWVERIDLSRLTRQDTYELAAAVLCREPDLAVVDALFHRTEGNPLFIETLLCCDGRLSAELPETLRDLLLASVHRLPEETQEVLRAASAGDGVTGHALLAAVTELADAALTKALRPAVIANVLRAAADGYVFRHELIREAVHEDLLPGEHGRLHSKFAEAIDADNSLVPPGRAAIEMAHHWNSAHDSLWALIASWQAAAQAGQAVAPAERLALLARVLELWDQVPDAAERIGVDHARVLEDAVAAAEDAGEHDRQIAFVTAALKDLDQSVEPVRVALLLSCRARAAMYLGRDQDEDFDRALALVPASLDPGTRAQILLLLARCKHSLNGEYAEEALALARQTGDQETEAQALCSLAVALAGTGQQAAPGSAPLEQVARSRELAERAGAHAMVRRTTITESHLLEGAGEHALALAAASLGMVGAQAQGMRTTASLLAINQAEPLYALGRWGEADEVIGCTLTFGPTQIHRSMLEVIKGQIALARGDLALATDAAIAARRVVRGAVYDDQHQLPAGAYDIALALATEGPAAALTVTEQVMDSCDMAGSTRYVWPVLTEAAASCIRAARRAGVAHDEQSGKQVAAVLGRLRDAAEKLEAFGKRQHAHRLTFDAAHATSTLLLRDVPGPGEAASAPGRGILPPPADAPAPTSVPGPVGTQAPAPAPAPAPASVSGPAGAPAPADVPAPASVPAPAPASVPAPGPAGVPASVPAPASLPGPADVPAPASVPGPVGTQAPASAPSPAGAPAPASAQAPASVPAPAGLPGPAGIPGLGEAADIGWDRVAAAWDEAATAWQALSEPYPVARALAHAADCAIAAGNRVGAGERLRQSAALADDLGARPLSAEIAALARRARIQLADAASGSRAAGSGADRHGTDRHGAGGEGNAAGDGSALTERELEVLRLVAAGRSNREIAAELFISPKTASVHVSNILGKLSVSTRTEAAARAHDLRLLA
jgi:DNA-binding CsgD family transcriptional regulator